MRISITSAPLVVGSLVLLSACGKTQEPVPAAATTAATAQPTGDAATGTEQGDPLAVLTINPNPIDLCGQEKKVAAVTVDWDLSRTKIRNYHVWVDSPTEPRKLWFSSYKPAGSKKTGDWVRNGTKFTITSPDGRELTSVVTTTIPCP
jgi:hypothetical protein